MIKHSGLYSLLLCLSLLAGCTSLVTQEVEVQLLPLAEPLDTADAQLSGLTWCQDKLVMLPQWPEFTSSKEQSESYLYAFDRDTIVAGINAHPPAPLKAQRLAFEDTDIRMALPGFDGCEAIVCKGNRVWLLIETKIDQQNYVTTVVEARFDNGMIAVDPRPYAQVKSQSGIHNFSDESALLTPEGLLTIHEANSTIEMPTATLVSLRGAEQRKVSMPNIPFRITDATELDAAHRFWVSNYRWQDGQHFTGKDDLIAREYPLGASHKRSGNVERLIELQWSQGHVSRTNTAPVYLKLTETEGRNWEGIARLEPLGLLLVSDQFPQTYFGFVPYPD